MKRRHIISNIGTSVSMVTSFHGGLRNAEGDNCTDCCFKVLKCRFTSEAISRQLLGTSLEADLGKVWIGQTTRKWRKVWHCDKTSVIWQTESKNLTKLTCQPSSHKTVHRMRWGNESMKRRNRIWNRLSVPIRHSFPVLFKAQNSK